MSCSTCDGYQLVPGDDGIYIGCPDCSPLLRCLAHDELVMRGRCRSCLREASIATDLLERARVARSMLGSGA